MRVDRQPRAKTQHLDINFVAFSKQPRFAAYRDRVYFLDADTETPILWLNEDHSRVTQVLLAPGTVGVGARSRDVFFDMIAGATWMQLFVRAAASLDEFGETTFDWQKGVLHEILPDIYPEFDEETRLAETYEKINDPTQMTELLHQVDLLLQAKHDYARHMTALVEEALDE